MSRSAKARPGRFSPSAAPRARQLALLVASAAALMSQATQAQAQETPASESPAAASTETTDAKAQTPPTLDAITITATRRREPVREVPMQVNLMKGEELERSGAKGLPDYLAEQPGVNLTSSGTVGGVLSMRGLTTGPSQTVATVGVYVDDVATGLSSSAALGGFTPLDMGLLDLNHIEVLRGPQGTLYGAGAMGGVLKYVTNQPDTTEFSGSMKLGASATQGGGPGMTLSGVVNIPLKEDVAGLRIAGFTDRVGGSYDAVGPAAMSNVNRGHTEGGRLSLLLTPTRELTVRLTGTVQDIKRKGLGYEDLDMRTLRPVIGERQRFLSVREPYANRTAIIGADVEYDFGWARLNSITSAQDTEIRSNTDMTGLYGPALRAAGLPVSTVPLFSNVDQNRVSQEFRLTSRSGIEFEWLAGLYLNRERGAVNGGINANVTGSPNMVNLLTSSTPSRYRETAAYGDVTWNATPSLSITGGVRISHNSQSYTNSGDGLLVGGKPIQGGESASDNATTYLGTIKYALDKTSNVYFRAASGYRPGGPNALKPDTDRNIVKPMYTSDTLWSYELGYKADLLDRTLSIEGALYDIEWSDIQQPIKSGNFTFVTNAGKARVRGAELALNWRPNSAWNVNASTSLINGKLLDDAQGLGAKAGDRMPDTARFSGVLGVTHFFKLADHNSYVGASVRYTGQRNSGYPGSVLVNNVRMPAFSIVDLQAGMDFKSFSLAAYVRNATNKRGIVSVDPGLAPASNPYQTEAALTLPRTIGVNMTVPF
ncbi:TonB-dependent receptor [Diaphorobacter ruginosibacter]|uniref:TonB-dependent receptor n=1 Tax=Diaphorobacter ruginosibacter TaxID=1715720 RepID=A0A7G9RPM9_9BURK|nr:TonB-dependent receptor [Diaphorobacter ruginosibacter]QNN57554.1 TonB-dependent receptor [Diaphorobacter ruginosibacter]